MVTQISIVLCKSRSLLNSIMVVWNKILQISITTFVICISELLLLWIVRFGSKTVLNQQKILVEFVLLTHMG